MIHIDKRERGRGGWNYMQDTPTEKVEALPQTTITELGEHVGISKKSDSVAIGGFGQNLLP